MCPASGGRAMLTAILILVAVWIAVSVHDFLEGEHLLADVLDEWRLHRADLAALDRAWQSSDKTSGVIVTLTSTPSRLPRIGLTVKSLLRQSSLPQRIVVNLPHFSKREQCDYDVPDWLQGLKSVEIHRCEDIGPATKLLPSLNRFPQGTKLLAVDDDRIYHAGMIACLQGAANRHPGCALGMSGWSVPDDLIDRPTTVVSNVLMRSPAPIRATRLSEMREVDILQGMSGYLVRADFFDMKSILDYGDAPPAAFFVDDVWIAGHCLVPRFVVPASRTNYQSKLWRLFYKSNSLGHLNRGPGGDENRNNSIMLKHLASRWRGSHTPGRERGRP